MSIAETRILCRGKILPLGAEPVIMGILNVTPDSFSDGGQYFDLQQAVEHGLEMVQQGAKIIDVGGESTRPGSAAVSDDEQIRRTAPVIRELAKQTDALISIDTTRSAVARAAIDAGAHIINDISAMRFDEGMAGLAAKTGAAVVLMHMQGTPATMQQNPTYQDVVGEVFDFLRERIAAAMAAGIRRESLIADPGIGFGKTIEHNLMLLKQVGKFHELGVAVLVGASCKAFIGKILGIQEPADRVFGSVGAAAWCAAAGVRIFRVHDVRATYEAAKIIAAIQNQESKN